MSFLLIYCVTSNISDYKVHRLHGGILMFWKVLSTKDANNERDILDFEGIELYFHINLLSVYKRVHMNVIFETTWKSKETLLMCGYRL